VIAAGDRRAFVGDLVGMPQKRNAFLLEHLKAKAGRAVGAWAAAAHTMASTPFTNSIEVGTEATAALWPGLEAAEHAVLLAQVLVSGGRPVGARMVERAEDGFTVATAVANRLVRAGVPFRTAHQRVGSAVRRAVEAGSTRLGAIDPLGPLDSLGLEDVSKVMRAHAYGGGPGAFAAPFRRGCDSWAGHRSWRRTWRISLSNAEIALARAARAV
jgi:argininosuccinate lyase